MQIEIMAFWGFFCLTLIGLAEFRSDFRILGVIGCMLLVPMAFWIWDSGVEVQTGTTTTTLTVQNTTLSGTTIISNDTSRLARSPISLPWFDIRNMLTMVFLGLSIYGSVHYASILMPGETNLNKANYYRQ
jgi:hypothetical protein